MKAVVRLLPLILVFSLLNLTGCITPGHSRGACPRVSDSACTEDEGSDTAFWPVHYWLYSPYYSNYRQERRIPPHRTATGPGPTIKSTHHHNPLHVPAARYRNLGTPHKWRR